MIKQGIVIILALICLSAAAQQNSIDSLNLALSTTEGTGKIKLLVALQKANTCKNDSLATSYFRQVMNSEGLPIKEEISALATFGNMQYCAKQLDSAIYYYQKAAYRAQSQSNDQESPALISKLGFLYQITGKMDSSAIYFRKGLKIAVKVPDSLSIGSISVGLGTYYQHKGQMDSAVSLYLRALQIAELIRSKELLITARLNLSTYYYDHQPNKLRIADFEKLLELTREIGDQRREMSVLEWLGYLQTDSGEFDLAIEYFNQGLEVSRDIHDTYGELLLLQGISHTYNTTGDNQKSIDANYRIIDMALSTGYEAYLPSIYANNVTNYLDLGLYDYAVQDGLEAIKTGKKSGQVELYYKVYQDLGTAYAKLGQPLKAYDAQVEYSRLNAEILDEAKSRQLAEMETKFETEKKEAEIATLSNQAIIQELEIKQKNTAIAIGLVLLVFVATGTYLFLRQRNLKNQQAQMELEQRFLRSQLNPHFISNALLAVQNFMLKNQSETAALYLSKFAKLMRETLENSRKEFVLLEDELNMLSNFIDIHKMRMNDSFDYLIEVSEDIDPESDAIPPMFAQPFVENAIEHGLANTSGRGQINLRFTKEDDYIKIVIEDNGKGITDQAGKTDHNSLSTTIIQERMEVFNQTLKQKIKLIIKNIVGENDEIQGTRVELKVPFR